MAWARVQSKNGAAVATTCVVTLTGTPVTGNKILVYISGVSGPVTSVKDSNLVTLTQAASANSGPGNNISYLYFYDVPATPSTTFTVTGTSSTWSVVVQEISGLLAGNTTACLDGTAGTVTNAAATSPLGATYSSTAANEFLCTFFGDWGNTANATVPSGMTADANNINSSSTADACVGYKDSTNGSESLNWTFTTSGDSVAIFAVAFKLAAGAAGGVQSIAQPGQTWLRRFRRRQTPWPTTPPPVAPVSTVASWLRQRRGPPPGQAQSSYWQPAPTGRTNAPQASWLRQRRGTNPNQGLSSYWQPAPTGQVNRPRASWIQGHSRTTVNKAGRFWAPVPTGQRNAPVANWIRQRRQGTPTGRGRFWGPPPPPPVTVPSGVASFMRQRVGKVNQARGRFWAPRSTGQINAPVPSYYRGRARPTVNKAGRYWAPVPTGQTNAPVPSYYHGRSRVIVNKAGRYWQPVPIPPATIARTVASWIRQRTGTVPQGRGRFWYPRSAGQANVPRASWMRQTPQPVPPVHRGQFWVAPPVKPTPQAAPPSFLSRGVRPTSRPRYGGKFWSRLYPAAATTVSKPVSSWMRQRRGRTVSDRGRWWPVVPPPPIITVIPPVTVTGSTAPTVTVSGSTASTVTSSGSSAARTSVSGSTAPATTATGSTGPTVPLR